MAKFEKIENSTQLMNRFAKKRPSGTFLLLGEENGEKEKCISLFAKNFFSGERNIQIFHCDSDEFLEGAGFALSSDMFLNEKITVFKKIESALKKKSNKSIVEEIVAHANEENLVIFESAANYAPAAIKALYPAVTPAIFWKKFESDLSEYIHSMVIKAGKQIDYTATSLILTLCGRSIEKIDDALKNILYGCDERSITQEVVSRVIEDNREVSIFECIDALFRKEKESISLLQKLLESGTHELVVISMIASRLNQLETWHTLALQNIPLNARYETVKIAPRQRPLFEQSTRKFTPQQVRALIIELYKTEKLLKSSPQTKNILANPLIDFIFSIIT